MAEPDAAERLRRHRETFITAADFAWIAGQGLDLVRLPVGYWVLDGDPPFLPAADVLDRGHGHRGRARAAGAAGPARRPRARRTAWTPAPGSARSCGTVSGPPRAHRPVRWPQLVRRYRDHPALWGIELLNEPIDWRVWRLWRFHRSALPALLPLLRPGTRVVFSDGYLPWLLRGSLRGREDSRW